MNKPASPGYVKNPKLIQWVQESVLLTKPPQVHWCDGSAALWVTPTSIGTA
jgi:phosphoenolpyruvate carboxykinase (GTP)